MVKTFTLKPRNGFEEMRIRLWVYRNRITALLLSLMSFILSYILIIYLVIVNLNGALLFIVGIPITVFLTPFLIVGLFKLIDIGYDEITKYKIFISDKWVLFYPYLRKISLKDVEITFDNSANLRIIKKESEDVINIQIINYNLSEEDIILIREIIK